MDKNSKPENQTSLPKDPQRADEPRENAQHSEKILKNNNSDSKEKYKRLKRKYAQLLQEHSKILSEFEVYVEEMNKMCEERKFLRNKINCILKTQGYNVALGDKQVKNEGI